MEVQPLSRICFFSVCYSILCNVTNTHIYCFKYRYYLHRFPFQENIFPPKKGFGNKTQNKWEASEKVRFEGFFNLNMIVISWLWVTSNTYEICIFTERYWTAVQRFPKYILVLFSSEKTNELVVRYSEKVNISLQNSPLCRIWDKRELLSSFVFLYLFQTKLRKNQCQVPETRLKLSIPN